MKPVIVFDFDGTIADAEEALMNIYNSLQTKHNWRKLTREDYYRLRRSRPREIMRWAGIKIWQIPRLLTIGRREYKKHINEITLFPGISKVIDKLSREHDIYILSSNDQSTVKKILTQNKLTSEVKILKGSSLFGKDKALKKLLRSRRYSAKDSWMIGDEIRDIEAGRKAKMNTIAVTWGLQSADGLKKAQPSHLAKKPADILTHILN